MSKSLTSIKKYSPLRPKDWLSYTILMGLGAILTIAFGIWWFMPSHVPHNFPGDYHFMDIVLFALVTYVVWYQIINELFSWKMLSRIKHPKHMRAPAPDKYRVAFLTAFVPGKEPYDVLESTLKAMVATDYPHYTWLLDEGDDPIAKALCEKYGAKHYSRKGIERYNQATGKFKAKTKAGNYNSWFDQNANQYDIVAQLDVDFIPTKGFLTRTLGYFSDPEVAFVGTPQIYGNTDSSWIAGGAAEQAFSFYGPLQKGFFGQDMTLFIGANHVVRVSAHDDIEGYSGHIVEDHLTGMKFYANKWKSVYLPETLAIGEGPETWEAYFSQQMRWAYGLMDILHHKSPKLFTRMRLKHAVNYFLLQQYYYYGLAQVIGVALLTAYFFTGVTSAAMSPPALLELFVPLLVIQQIVFLWSQRFNVEPFNERGFMLRGKLLSMAAWPIYFWAFLKVASGKDLVYQVTTKGGAQGDHRSSVKLFIPHLILGTITLVDILVGVAEHREAPLLMFWAGFISVFMFGFVLEATLPRREKSIGAGNRASTSMAS